MSQNLSAEYYQKKKERLQKKLKKDEKATSCNYKTNLNWISRFFSKERWVFPWG